MVRSTGSCGSVCLVLGEEGRGWSWAFCGLDLKDFTSRWFPYIHLYTFSHQSSRLFWATGLQSREDDFSSVLRGANSEFAGRAGWFLETCAQSHATSVRASSILDKRQFQMDKIPLLYFFLVLITAAYGRRIEHLGLNVKRDTDHRTPHSLNVCL